MKEVDCLTQVVDGGVAVIERDGRAPREGLEADVVGCDVCREVGERRQSDIGSGKRALISEKL